MVNVNCGLWEIAESYGRVGIELANGIEALGVHVNRIGANEKQRFELSYGGFLLGYPTHYHKYPMIAQHGTRIAVTMFESTALPEGWVENLNTLTACILPSQWLVQIFRDAGVTIPIHVIPLGVSEVFKHTRRKRFDPTKPLRFLAIADRMGRKGWYKTITAFHALFGDDPCYELILKTRTPGLQLTNPNIKFLCGDYGDKRMAKLYTTCDVMIFPSAGEGFGLPPREFAATGGLAVATNWGGLADDLPLWGVALNDYQLAPAWKGDPDLDGLGLWAETSVDEIAHTMQMIAQNREHFYEVGKLNGKWVREHYNWSDFARQAYTVYEGVSSGNHRIPA